MLGGEFTARTRTIAAVVVVGAATVGWSWLGWMAAGDGIARAIAAYAPLVLSFAGATLGLILRLWWGRMLALSVALFSALDAGGELAVAPEDRPALVIALGGLILLACLLGRRMFERYEGSGPPWWRKPGMAVARWAVIAGGCTLLVAAKFLNDAAVGLGFLAEQPVLRPVRVGTFAAAGGLALVLLVGMALIIRRKDAGLLVTGLSTLALGGVLVTSFVWDLMAVQLTMMLAPGWLAALAALLAWSQSIGRSLRRREPA